MMYDQLDGIQKISIITATLMESGLLIITGSLIGLLLPILGYYKSNMSNYWLFLIVLVAFFLIFIFFLPRLRKKVDKQVIRLLFTIDRKELLIAIISILVGWWGGGILLYLTIRSIITIEIGYLPVLTAVWGLASAVGISIGFGMQGFGVREITLGSLLSLLFPPILSFPLAIGFRLILTVSEVLWTVVLNLSYYLND
jgi:hypothetical protein